MICVIHIVLAGEDVITVAPTGSGKSDLLAGMIDEFQEVETHACSLVMSCSNRWTQDTEDFFR